MISKRRILQDDTVVENRSAQESLIAPLWASLCAGGEAHLF
jgi:hypothetical protein